MRVRRAVLAVQMVLATGVCLGAGPVASFAAAPPTTATAPAGSVASRSASAADQGTGDQAQRRKDAVDRHVALLATSIASESKHLATLSTTASLAEQDFITQQADEAQARIAETVAQGRLTLASSRYLAAHHALVEIAVSSYQSGGPGSISTSSVASLLTVSDPGAVLSVATTQRMLGDHEAVVVSQLTLAVQSVRLAERTQRAALDVVTRQTARLAEIYRQARATLAASRVALVDLQADLVTAKASQKQADAALSTFLGGWSAADPARAGALNRQYEAVALTVLHAKPAPRSTHWTAAMGQTAVNRALQYLGTHYAWAGGDAIGPTRGTCAGGGAEGDCHLIGFDCSGLALYAWAPYLSMTHNAAIQYGSGKVHPSPAALLPGDLAFWSSNDSAAGIHHVAIYIGDGFVIQAPQSGDIVRITPIGSVSSGYFGATRPLS